jgi:hypothetical protein
MQPTNQQYKEFILRATQWLKISELEARALYGHYTVAEWLELFKIQALINGLTENYVNKLVLPKVNERPTAATDIVPSFSQK